ncbi:MAG: cytochrome c3 family protein [Stygiobacter sp.]
MKLLLTIFILSLNVILLSQSPKVDQCFQCHLEIGSIQAEQFVKDIHKSIGLSCSSCHGGDNTTDNDALAMSPKNGFIGKPKQSKISEICASCHSNPSKMKKYGSDIITGQFEKLKKSVHGKASTDANTTILQCTTCHNAHGIVKVNNPSSPVYRTNIPVTCGKCHSNVVYMQKYNPSLPVDQIEKYRTSKHGMLNKAGNKKAAACADCHGSHNIFSAKDVRSSVYPTNIPTTCSKCHSNKEYMKEFKIPTDQFEKYKESVHGIALLKKNDISAPACNDCHGNHAATPPGISSISKVCGTCHALNAELFASSPHKKAFEKNNYPECETCHNNHNIAVTRDELLGVSKSSICSKCHSQNEQFKGYSAASEMRKLMDDLTEKHKIATSKIFEAEQKGMEVEEIKFRERDINSSILEARTVIHSFDVSKFKEVIKKGEIASDEVISDAKSKIDEFYIRRIGLVVAILFSTLLMILIYLYLKRIEKEKNI